MNCEFALTKSSWALVTKPFTQRVWESRDADTKAWAVVKSGVNGTCMILSALASVIMAVATPIFAGADLIYGPIKAKFCPAVPKEVVIISSKEFYDGAALEGGITFKKMLAMSNEEIEANCSCILWMFPMAEKLEESYRDKLERACVRMQQYSGENCEEVQKRIYECLVAQGLKEESSFDFASSEPVACGDAFS